MIDALRPTFYFQRPELLIGSFQLLAQAFPSLPQYPIVDQQVRLELSWNSAMSLSQQSEN